MAMFSGDRGKHTRMLEAHAYRLCYVRGSVSRWVEMLQIVDGSVVGRNGRGRDESGRCALGMSPLLLPIAQECSDCTTGILCMLCPGLTFTMPVSVLGCGDF